MTLSGLLLLDVGNTTIKIGVLPAQGSMAAYSLPTQHFATSDALGLQMAEICRREGLAPESVEAWVISSVVPQLEPTLTAAAERYCRCPVLFAPADLPLSLNNRYERPQEVGADRLVTAYAATRLYDAPGFIVIDFGTATTFDCVAGNDYLGGLICPGILSSASALSSRTAKLPQATLRVDPTGLHVGRSTSASLNQGLVYGFAAMAEGLVERLKPLLPAGSLVVATGGFAERLAPVCRAFDHVRPDLLLEGLRLAYRDRQSGA
jgi:type III pantothenate kinase